MKAKYIAIFSLALISVLTIITTYSVWAGEEKEALFEKEQPAYLRHGFASNRIKSSHLVYEELAMHEYEKSKVPVLKPEIFDNLSKAGKLAALRSNGLLEQTKGEVYSSPRLSDADISPLAPAPGQNVRANDPSVDRNFHSQSESSIGVKGQTVIITYNDAEIINNSLSSYAISTDGGSTFASKRITSPNGNFSFGDGVVAFDNINNITYYASLYFTKAGTINEKDIVGISRSVDNGLNFSAPAIASTGDSSSIIHDKEWIAVDNNTNSTFKGNLYITYTDFTVNGSFIGFARSTDKGQTFIPSIAISKPNTGDFAVQGSRPIVGPNGEVYVVYFDGNAGQNGGISLAKSTDGGKTFSNPKTITSLNTIGEETGGNSVRTNSFPSIAVDGKGVIHVVYASIADPKDRSDVFYIRSIDGGNTFSSPTKLNDDNSLTSQFLPSVSVTSSGIVMAKWWDRRNDPTNDVLTDIYMTISQNGGTSFGKNFRITDTNWAFGPADTGSDYHGDYDDSFADNNNFYLCWSDERAALSTGTADPDVYFAAIPVTRPDNLADFNVSATKIFDSVIAGNTTSFDLTTRGDNGFSTPLSLTASPSISGISYSFDSSSVTPGQTAKLNINTSAATKPGTYVVTVSGSGGGLTRSTTFRLTVFDSTRFASIPTNASKSSGFTNVSSGLKIDASGTIHLAFDDDSASPNDSNFVFYTQSTDGGKTYSNPIRISTNGSIASAASLALDPSGNIYITWTNLTFTDTSQNGTLFISKSTDKGKTFSNPVAITNPAAQPIADASQIVIDSKGNINVGYGVFTNSSAQVFLIRSTDGGNTFSAPTQVNETGDILNGTSFQIAVDSTGAVYGLYNNIVGLNGRVTASNIKFVSSADGKTFSSSKQLSSSQLFAFASSISLDSKDNIFVSYYNRVPAGGNNFNREVVVLKSTDKGGSFSSEINVSNNAGQSTFPSIIVDANGGINVAWQDSQDNDQLDIFMSRSTDGGVSFSAPTNLSFNSGLSFGVSTVADSKGNVFFTWTDDSPGNTEVFVNPLIFVSQQPTTPSITGFSPNTGAVGTTITIQGSSFQGATAVVFGGNVTVTPNNFTVSNNGNQITTKVPTGAQTGAITVTTPLGSTTSTAVFTVINGDFALTLSPSSQMVIQGSSTSFNVGVQAIGTFTSMVNLSATVSSANSAITTSFSSASVAPGATSTLTVNTTASTPATTFTINITGTSGQLTKTSSVTVVVAAGPDYMISFNPSTVNVTKGMKGQFTVNIGRTGGFNGNVTVSIPSDAASQKIKITPSSLSSTGNSVAFTFKVKPAAQSGSKQLVFTAKDDSGRARTATLTLVVK